MPRLEEGRSASRDEMLGPLERDVVAVLREVHEGRTRDVLRGVNARGHKVAYTTVSTILTRLHGKGLIDRRPEPFRGGERYVYAYRDIQDAYIDDLLDGLVRVYGGPGIERLAERIQVWRRDEARRVLESIKV